MEVGLPDG